MSKSSTVRQMTWKETITPNPFKVPSLPNTGPLRWTCPRTVQLQKKPARPLRRPLRLDKAWFMKSRDWEDTSVEISVHSDQSCALTSYPCFVYIAFIQVYVFLCTSDFQPSLRREHTSNTQIRFQHNENTLFHQILLYHHEQPRRHWFRFLR